MPSRPIQILLVAAHPADSFDQAGGTLAHHVARGDKVTVVIATTGVRSHHWELKDEKQREGHDLDVETKNERGGGSEAGRKPATPAVSVVSTIYGILGSRMTTFCWTGQR